MKRNDISILVVDDDRDVLLSAELCLKQFYHTVKSTDKPSSISSHMEEGHYDIILLDMNFTKGKNDCSEGLEWLSRIRDKYPSVIIIMITAYGDIELAIKCIKEGAHDFIVKPWQNEKLLATLNGASRLSSTRKDLEQSLVREKKMADQLESEYGEFIEESPPMKRLGATINKIAPTTADVLILGESGSGKEMAARKIHKLSGRSTSPFIRVDMGAISESLFESELFGHKAGSFTGAINDRKGYFEIASGGTLFIDEVANLPFKLQGRLLTAIESRTIARVGESLSVPFNARLITASNADLHEMVREGRFRKDLLYRLNMIELRIPPLRDRPEDIPYLIKYFIDKYGMSHGRKGLKISTTILSRLSRYNWPGNVRELAHAVERAVILCEGSRLEYSDFLTARNIPDQRRNETLNLGFLEMQTIVKALQQCNGNITLAAERLGITRASLYRRIEKYGI